MDKKAGQIKVQNERYYLSTLQYLQTCFIVSPYNALHRNNITSMY